MSHGYANISQWLALIEIYSRPLADQLVGGDPRPLTFRVNLRGVGIRCLVWMHTGRVHPEVYSCGLAVAPHQ